MFRACLIFLVYIVNACFASQKLILKIDYNVRTDKQTSLNELNITLVNKTTGERKYGGVENNWEISTSNANDITSHFNKNSTNKFESNEINTFDQNNKMNSIYDTLKHGSLNNNDSVSKVQAERNANNMDFTHIIPVLQDKGDKERIKDNLKHFAMLRKKTYVATPKFDFPISKFDKMELEYKENKLNRRYNHEDIDYIGEGTIKRQNSEIFDILYKQNTLIEKIANQLLKEKKRKANVARTQFKDIVASLEARQNRSSSVKTSTTTGELSTIMTLIDETEIKEALKKDPFVKRILQMANKKRVDYEKQFG